MRTSELRAWQQRSRRTEQRWQEPNATAAIGTARSSSNGARGALGRGAKQQVAGECVECSTGGDGDSIRGQPAVRAEAGGTATGSA